jgi:hypothetical protein
MAVSLRSVHCDRPSERLTDTTAVFAAICQTISSWGRADFAPIIHLSLPVPVQCGCAPGSAASAAICGAACVACPAGSYCTGGSAPAVACVTPTPGSYCGPESSIDVGIPCPSGYYCTGGSAPALLDVTPGDRAALVDLYTAAGGAGWTYKTGWNTSAGVCTWAGVTCSGDGSRVTQL